MQSINMIMIYYWDKKLKKKKKKEKERLYFLEADISYKKKKTTLIWCLPQKMHFLQDVFQITTIVLVSVINHYHINGLHLFWDTLHECYLCSMSKRTPAQLAGPDNWAGVRYMEYADCTTTEK